MSIKNEKSTSTHGAGVLCSYEGKFLLVQMNYGKFKGHWILPGGMMEKGEHPHLAAIRELKEETDLTANIKELLTIRYRVSENHSDNTYWVYIAELTDFQGVSQLKWNSNELMNVDFFSIDQIRKNKNIRPHTKYYIELYLEKQKKMGVVKMDGSFNDFCY